jgi:FixJ family two-component response regulator
MAFMVKPFDGRELLEGIAQATTTKGRQRERQRAALDRGESRSGA